MWNEIFGALAILAMVVACVVLIPAMPKLIDAIAYRIRHGVQAPSEPQVEEPEHEQVPAKPAAAPARRSTKPAATTSKTAPVTVAKPTSQVRGTAAAA